MRMLVALMILLPVCGEVFATGDSLRYLLPKDTVFLNINAFGEKEFVHFLERKQTLYSLARFYGLSVEELYYFNPGLKENVIHVGQSIRVPIPNRAIRRYKGDDFKAGEYTPVYYVVRKGDTMYSIAKKHFRMEPEEMMTRNRLASADLKAGQLLHVGWMNVNGIPEEYRQFAGGPMARRNNALKMIYMQEMQEKREREDQGVAVWQKNSTEDADLYALHRRAAKNSIIAITNPMNNRMVYAKVIGRIPETAYPDNNIVVVLSPLAAKLLGAVDQRFFVRVKHY